MRIPPTPGLSPAAWASLLSLAALPLLPGLLQGEGCPPEGEPSPPFSTTVRRGVDGRYHIFGRDWSYDPVAYSWRYHTAWDRLSVYVADRTECEAIRVRQPPGCGPPRADLYRRFAVAEVELYDRSPDERTRYRRIGNLLSPGSTIRVSDSRQGHGPEHLVDRILISPQHAPAWASGVSLEEHWIEIEFDEPVAWNQLVLYWPTRREPGPWANDAEVVEGLRAQCLCVDARVNGRWRELALTEARPGARHDGAFVGELSGLADDLPGRLTHLEAFSRWRDRVRRDPEAVPSEGEIAIGTGWTIGFPSNASSLVEFAAQELGAFLMGSMGCGDLSIASPSPASADGEHGLPSPEPARRPPMIVLSTWDTLPPTERSALPESTRAMLSTAATSSQSFAVVVTEDAVHAVGRDSLATRYAACRIEERMRRRGAPFLEVGVEHRRPAFRPRIATGVAFGTGGPDGFGFPDEYLSLMAHHYLDGIYIFQNGLFLNDPFSVIGLPSEPTLPGDPEKAVRLRNLVRRAGRQGLGVYWCLTVPGVLPRAFYDDHPGIGSGTQHTPASICYSALETKSLIRDSIRQLLREVPGLAGLVVLRSELNHGCGGYFNCVRCRQGRARRDDPALKVHQWVFEAAREVDPAIEIIVFDWRGGLQRTYQERLSLEIGYWFRPDTLYQRSPENHLAMTAPAQRLIRSLTGDESGRKVWVELQPSHPFPFHVQPEMPVPGIYWAKMGALRGLMATRPDSVPPFGYAQGNGGGFVPFAMSALMHRVLLWDPLPTRDEALRTVAGDWYGVGNEENVLAAWDIFDEAVLAHGGFTKYLIRRSLVQSPGAFDPDDGDVVLASLDSLTMAWRDGLAHLERARARAPAWRREQADLNVDLADGALLAITSLANAVRWFDRYGVTPVDGLPEAIDKGDRPAALAILEAERANLERVIALYARRSVFRYHPYYRNLFSLPVLVAKRRDLEARIAALEP